MCIRDSIDTPIVSIRSVNILKNITVDFFFQLLVAAEYCCFIYLFSCNFVLRMCCRPNPVVQFALMYLQLLYGNILLMTA